MTDRDFLIWIHERLEHVYKEDPLMDYMHRLRDIIYSIPKDQKSYIGQACNDMDDLLKLLEKKNES